MNDTRILRLVFFPTGGFGSQAIRPYRSQVTDDVLNTLESRTEGFRTFNRRAFAGSGLLTPDVDALGELSIVHGMQAQRFMWWMEIEHVNGRGFATDRRIQLLTGYTDVAELSPSGEHIDPRTEMYVDTSMMLREIGEGRNRRRNLVEAHNYIPRQVGQTTVGRGDGYTLLRPRDVVNRVGVSKYITAGADLHDFRPSLRNTGLTSVTDNNIPSNYMSRICEGYRLAKSETESVMRDTTNLMENVAGNTRDAPSMRDKFIAAMLKTTSMGDNGMCFTYEELEDVFADVDRVTYLPDRRSMHAGLKSTGIREIDSIGFGTGIHDYVEDWHSSHPETQAAHIATNAVPAIMLRMKLTCVSFMITNDTVDEEPLFKWYAEPDSMVNRDMDFDFRAAMRAFEDEITHYLLPDLAPGGFMVSLVMHADLADADIRLAVSFDGQRERNYAAPMFALGRNSSVVGNNDSQLDHLSQSVQVIFDEIDQSTSSNFDDDDRDVRLALDSGNIRQALESRRETVSRPRGDDLGI